jgi:hypothetical protein
VIALVEYIQKSGTHTFKAKRALQINRKPMAFEQVKKAGQGGGSTEPMLSLRKSGGIGINSAAMEEHIPDAEYAELYFDEDNNKIGVKPVDEESEDIFKINQTESSGGITPTNFMKRHDLIPEVTTRYEVSWDDDEEMLVADLSEGEIGTYGSPYEDEEE